ncbi:hypothetical protein UT300012_39940 [Paraclostridium bifermentans]
MKIKMNKEVFKLAVLKSGLTIIQIAEKSNLSRYTIHRILNTSCTVNSSTVGRLANALEVDIESIILE